MRRSGSYFTYEMFVLWSMAVMNLGPVSSESSWCADHRLKNICKLRLCFFTRHSIMIERCLSSSAVHYETNNKKHRKTVWSPSNIPCNIWSDWNKSSLSVDWPKMFWLRWWLRGRSYSIITLTHLTGQQYGCASIGGCSHNGRATFCREFKARCLLSTTIERFAAIYAYLTRMMAKLLWGLSVFQVSCH